MSALEPGDPRHGTTTGYTYRGCRCTACRTAYNDWRRRKKASTAQPVVTPCIGWPGTCPTHGEMHGCRYADKHSSRHVCDCGELGPLKLPHGHQPEHETDAA